MGENDPRHRVEMKSLVLSDEATNKITDTLKFIHGEEFRLKDLSAYKDRGKRLDRQYWLDRGHLVVQGATNYSTKVRTILEPHAQVNQFAQAKLERHGFHSIHCREALRITNGDVGNAFELLMCRYFNLELPEPEPVPENLLEERSQELQSLRSIYENYCEEKIANQLWLIHLDLPYLADLYLEKPMERGPRPPGTKPSKEICRFFFRGKCRFGDDCRFSHESQKRIPVGCTDENRNKFVVEVRFPYGSRYPLEPPLVSIVATCSEFPTTACLRVTQLLLDEAAKSAKLEQPSVFMLVDLLENRREEVEGVLEGPAPVYFHAGISLFKKDDDNESTSDDASDGDHLYSEGRGGENRFSVTNEHIESMDEKLSGLFLQKQTNPQYLDLIKMRKKLPAWAKRQEVVNVVNSNPVVIVVGETGCGKSTQVPQFLLDSWMVNRKSNQHVEIICTQPRRISALGVAERVAYERMERVGNLVGYQIRLESKVSQFTRLTFCTTGILLRKLGTDPKLKYVTHVIVDEVHERSEESDFLLLILKDLLVIRPDLKVMLMSATLNAELFTNYFPGAPIIDIPGQTFPVQQYFLEDVVAMTGYVLEEFSTHARHVDKQMSRHLEQIQEGGYENCAIKGVCEPLAKSPDEVLPIKQCYYRYKDYPLNVPKTMFLTDAEKINYELIERLLDYIANDDHDMPREGSILVFLPGLAEILALNDQLLGNPTFAPQSDKFVIIPLHSTLTAEEQAAVFKKAKKGLRKLVISTNIAETSITIDDCVFVIDTGKMKENRYDANRKMANLETVWVSRANALQRKGRAGRVMPGHCFHLFSRQRFDYVIDSQPIPEICRTALEQLILRVKILPAFAKKDVHQTLSKLIEPPGNENIVSAVERLRDVGAIDEYSNLTALGRHLALLPVDVRIGKLILFGAIFCALDSALTIAACLSYKSPFVAPFNRRDEANNSKKKFVNGYSDHLTTLKAYRTWQQTLEKRGTRAANNYAQDNYLSSKTLVTLTDIKYQFLELLMDIGFVPGDISVFRRKNGPDKIIDTTGQELNANGENQRLLSAILCAALYPNIVKILTPDRIYQQCISGAIPTPLRPEELIFKTKSDGVVYLHPSSVNHGVSVYPSPYLVFQEKIKTSKVFIRECTMVPVIPLVLFSAGRIRVELNCGEFMVSLDDGWFIFPVQSHKVAELLESIKSELLALLDEKIKEPRMNLQTHPKGRRIISTIVHLVTSG